VNYLLLILPQARSMNKFTLLHITDLHIATTAHGFFRRYWDRNRECRFPSEANPYALRALAEFVFRHRTTFDIVVISGDLSEDGESGNLRAAYQYITAPATREWYASEASFTLDATRSGRPHFFLMPGNHDRFRGLRRLPGGIEFDAVFRGFWSTGIGGVQSHLLYADEPRLAIIAADFCLRQAADGPVWVGQGAAYRHVIDDLVQTTNYIKAIHPGIGILWISHFPPLTQWEYRSKLFHASDLLDAARSCGIRHVVAGHIHLNDTFSELDIEIICTGTASSMCDGETRGFWIQKMEVDVDDTGYLAIEITKYRYQHNHVAFVEEGD
jgi:3',5'-cyclic AMP phosphodiesterase CpdA